MAKAVTYIDSEEIALRIAEACIGNRRPTGVSAHDAMMQLEAIDYEVARSLRQAAKAVASYIADCCNREHPGSVELQTATVESEGVM